MLREAKDARHIAEEFRLEFASEDDSALDVPKWASPRLEGFQQLRAQNNANVLRGDWHGQDVRVFDRMKSIEGSEWGPDDGEHVHLTRRGRGYDRVRIDHDRAAS